MNVDIIEIFVGSTYIYTVGWTWTSHARRSSLGLADEDVRIDYDARKNDLPILAAEFGTAVKVAWFRDGELRAEHVYSGEKVRDWYAAYVMPGGKKIIDVIHANVTYYEVLFSGGGQKDVKTVAISDTIAELQQMLGKEFFQYDIMS